MEKEEVSYEVFNVGGGRRYTVLEFAKMAAEAYGQPFEPKLSGEFRLGDTRHIMSDISKLSQLGWKPRRDPRYSLECYKTWLYEKDVPEEVLDLSYNKMIASNVLIKAEGKQ
jgi:dTDP-L-rhamnose 4-epimerase